MVPSGDGEESISAAAWIRAKCDVIEAREAVAIQPRVEETECVCTSMANWVLDGLTEGRGRKGICTGAAHWQRLYDVADAVVVYQIFEGLRGDIGAAAALGRHRLQVKMRAPSWYFGRAKRIEELLEEVPPDLGLEASQAADASDSGTLRRRQRDSLRSLAWDRVHWRPRRKICHGVQELTSSNMSRRCATSLATCFLDRGEWSGEDALWVHRMFKKGHQLFKRLEVRRTVKWGCEVEQDA
ncbi:hypothetical protein EDB86DRAFT_2831702 [Lactarius hatsudake]|nr:hypothetical protein EDB86DRAFT_2831702 [Lactarius hatsudake]